MELLRSFIQIEHKNLPHNTINIGNNTEVAQFREDKKQPVFEGLIPPDVKYLFTEGSLSVNTNISPFELPPDNTWRKSFLQTKEELVSYQLRPHLHDPRVFYSVNPNTALKLACYMHCLSCVYT